MLCQFGAPGLRSECTQRHSSICGSGVWSVVPLYRATPRLISCQGWSLAVQYRCGAASPEASAVSILGAITLQPTYCNAR